MKGTNLDYLRTSTARRQINEELRRLVIAEFTPQVISINDIALDPNVKYLAAFDNEKDEVYLGGVSEAHYVMRVDIDTLVQEMQECGSDYIQIIDLVKQKIMQQTIGKAVRLDDKPILIGSKPGKLPMNLVYLDELKRCVLVMQNVFDIAEGVRRDNFTLLSRHIKPSNNVFPTNAANGSVAIAHINQLQYRFVERVTIQRANVKVNTAENAYIERIPRQGDWVTMLKRSIGRTPGTTVGGLLRRMRTGRLHPMNGRVFIINDSNGEFVYGFMSVQLDRFTGQTFEVPKQSVDMYINTAKEMWGNGCIQTLVK